jgi:hypothetical protein
MTAAVAVAWTLAFVVVTGAIADVYSPCSKAGLLRATHTAGVAQRAAK